MGWGYGLEAKLADWRREGLISDDQAARIAAFEASRGKPKLALALAVLGAFTIGVGIIAIIAANWDAIPIGPRLGLHILINLVLGGLVWHWAGPTSLSVRVEGGVLLLSLSTLALIAHIGQSFQLQGSASGLMGGWLLLSTPFTLALARGGLNRWVWVLGLFTWAGALLSDHWDWLHDRRLSASILILFLALLYLARLSPRLVPAVWARHLGRAAVGTLIGGLTVLLLVLRPLIDGVPEPDVMWDAGIGGVVGMMAIAAAHALSPGDMRGMRLGFGALLALAPPLSVLPFLLDGTLAAIVTGVLFCLYWIALARLALLTERPGWFRLAVALIAVRVFIAYLDATGGLLATGFGLVLAGLVLLGLAFAARRVMAWGEAQQAGEGT
ncbi:hypothetical protein IP70_06215 [alpha proteobacterium AAP38]|uniref:DUF2157 domain-containing protein n=1 Tax=Niveispirillum sp. TaxID=1917217 RepID=UPI0006B96487|nr:hypothetical protein IP70_06215 [alpha proteobacterium AAP38]